MAFMNFDIFLYARTDLRLFKIQDLEIFQNENIFSYKIKPTKNDINTFNESFFYHDKNDKIFNINDEILISKLNNKIILFRNYTQNSDNFKKAKNTHFKNLAIFFIISLLCIFFTILNNFGIVDLFLMLISLLLLTMCFINLRLLNKQIRILQNYSQKEMKHFLKKC